jgi:hypothetical protein
MAWTNFQNGLTSFGIPVFGNLSLPWVPGNVFFVKPITGSDGNDGLTPETAFKTVYYAHSRCTASQNDTVILLAESNTAASTTDYFTTTVTWSKDMTHLIGFNCGSPLSHRSRMAWSSTGYDGTATPLFSISADACCFANLQWFAGINDAQALGCVDVTGDRNVFYNCHIAGIGNDTQDAVGAYSLYLNGVEETLFKNCKIGLNTVDAGTAANSEILMANTVKNVFFEDCLIFRRIEHATNHPLVKVAAATSLDEFVMFDRCAFVSTSTNYGFIQGGVFKLVADLTQGIIIVKDSYAYNGPLAAAGKWDVDDRDKIKIVGHPTPAADTCSLPRAV